MNLPQHLNDPISVEGNLRNEALFPKKITWQKKHYQVISVGRQWSEGDKTHILLELDDGSRMEVTYAATRAWLVTRYWRPPAMAG